MAPTTRSSRKKKSPGSKQKTGPKKAATDPATSVISRPDDGSDISSDDDFSTDSEMEDLVRQTALKMTGGVVGDDGRVGSARGTKPRDSKSDTASTGAGLAFVLDSNPISQSHVRIEVDHVSELTLEPHVQHGGNEMEAGRRASKSSRSNSVREQSEREEEEFLSLDTATCASDSASTDHQRRKQKSKEQQQGKVKRKESTEMSTEIDAGLDFSDTYFNFANTESRKAPASPHSVLQRSCQDKLLKKSIITPDFEKNHSVPPYREATRLLNKRKKKERESSTGQDWYNMAAAEMTDKLRHDIKALRMRSTLDPKRFYKHNDMTAMPKFVQIGTVMDSPADFYHSRVPKKQRKQTIVEELLADSDTRRYNKRKYLELQERSKRSRQRGKRSKMGRKKGKK